MFYLVCPKQTVNLIHYPESLIPGPVTPLLSLIFQVIGQCVDNAQTDNGLPPRLYCISGGSWGVTNASACHCSPGYLEDDGECKIERE